MLLNHYSQMWSFGQELLMLCTNIFVKSLGISKFIPTIGAYVVHRIFILMYPHVLVQAWLIHILLVTRTFSTYKCFKFAIVQSTTFGNVCLLGLLTGKPLVTLWAPKRCGQGMSLVHVSPHIRLFLTAKLFPTVTIFTHIYKCTVVDKYIIIHCFVMFPCRPFILKMLGTVVTLLSPPSMWHSGMIYLVKGCFKHKSTMTLILWGMERICTFVIIVWIVYVYFITVIRIIVSR